MQQLKGIIALTRYKEFLAFVVVTTFLGAQVSGGAIDARLLLVLLANWLAVGFSFMINDVEDAPDDALNPDKINRNPVSAGTISTRTAYIASFAVALLAGIVYFFLGSVPFWLGIICLTIGFLYSWRVIRFKRVPLLDLASHGMLLAGLQLLCAYYTFAPSPGTTWIAPFIFVVSISLYGELFNEVRDLEGDLKAGVTHTAAIVGERVAEVLMMLLLIAGAVSFVYSIISGVIPLWVLGVMTVLGLIMLIRPLLSMRRGSLNDLIGPLHVPAQVVAALTMTIWVIGGMLQL